MTPAQVTTGMLDTFDVALYLVGFVAVFALVGSLLGYKQVIRWRIEKPHRWGQLYR